MHRDFKGIWIPREFWLIEGLSPMEKILWSEIDSLYDEEKKGCFASNEYLARFMQVKERTVRDVLCKLRKLKLIEDVSFDGRQRVIKALLPDSDYPNRLAKWRKSGIPTDENPAVCMPEIRQAHLYIESSLEQRREKPLQPLKNKPAKRTKSGGVGGVFFSREERTFINLTSPLIQTLSDTFPGVNVSQQLNEMKLWLIDNPQRTGTMSFITKWLKKSFQDLPQPYVRQEESTREVDPELAQLMKERDERIKREMEFAQEELDRKEKLAQERRKKRLEEHMKSEFAEFDMCEEDDDFE